ncbi:MAG: hypothetical protein IJS80_07185, partial [Lachnospiraceae bacterium]|nr:hypothetical protein [Lachnospiraceae bacterium]
MKTYLLMFWKKISHNFGLKLLALVSAFFIWVGVVNSQDPIDTITFYNVPVKILNEDSLIRKDKIPEVVDGSTVTVTVQARKSICDKLTEEAIIATADFEKIYVTDTVPIEVKVEGYDEKEAEIIRGQNAYMKLSLEDYATKEFKIKINNTGTPADGFVVGTNASSPNVITIRGSKLQISRIQAVVATVNVNGINKTSEVVVNPVIYDANDEEISTENLELSSRSVSVTTTLYKTKTLNLEAVTFGDVATGYEIKSVSAQPSSITVAGTDEDLAKLGNSLRAYVDVTGLSGNVESNIGIYSLIDSKLSSIKILDDDTTLAVTAYIGEQRKMDVGISNSDIEVRGLSDELIPYSMSLSSRLMTVRAVKEAVDSVRARTLHPYLDLTYITAPGTYQLTLQTDPEEGVVCLSKLYVTVQIDRVHEVPQVDEPQEGGSETKEPGAE